MAKFLRLLRGGAKAVIAWEDEGTKFFYSGSTRDARHLMHAVLVSIADK